MSHMMLAPYFSKFVLDLLSTMKLKLQASSAKRSGARP